MFTYSELIRIESALKVKIASLYKDLRKSTQEKTKGVLLQSIEANSKLLTKVYNQIGLSAEKVGNE